jgi:hypothetical protein
MPNSLSHDVLQKLAAETREQSLQRDPTLRNYAGLTPERFADVVRDRVARGLAPRPGATPRAATAKPAATMSRSELAALEASCQAKDEPTFSDAECATYRRTLGLDLRSRSQAQLDRIFQTEERPTQSASFDGVRQSFGKPARHDVEPNALDSAFADTSPSVARGVETRGNVQTFGVKR